jgi:hypothetical protein
LNDLIIFWFLLMDLGVSRDKKHRAGLSRHQA